MQNNGQPSHSMVVERDFISLSSYFCEKYSMNKVRIDCNTAATLYGLLTKTTAAQNEVALSYDRVRGLYFLAVVFAATIVYIIPLTFEHGY